MITQARDAALAAVGAPDADRAGGRCARLRGGSGRGRDAEGSFCAMNAAAACRPQADVIGGIGAGTPRRARSACWRAGSGNLRRSISSDMAVGEGRVSPCTIHWRPAGCARIRGRLKVTPPRALHGPRRGWRSGRSCMPPARRCLLARCDGVRFQVDLGSRGGARRHAKFAAVAIAWPSARRRGRGGVLRDRRGDRPGRIGIIGRRHGPRALLRPGTTSG